MRDDVQSVLNDLIETSLDGEKEFLRGAEDANEADLKSLLTRGAKRCREGAAKLQAVMRTQGRIPVETGSAAGALHRGWMILKETVAEREDKAILEECERGEDYAKAQYEKALKNDLPPEIRSIVER